VRRSSAHNTSDSASAMERLSLTSSGGTGGGTPSVYTTAAAAAAAAASEGEGNQGPQSPVPSSTAAATALAAQAAERDHSRNTVRYSQAALDFFAVRVREASRSAAQKLLARVDGMCSVLKFVLFFLMCFH
jgi:hypothetical protein